MLLYLLVVESSIHGVLTNLVSLAMEISLLDLLLPELNHLKENV